MEFYGFWNYEIKVVLKGYVDLGYVVFLEENRVIVLVVLVFLCSVMK